MCFYVGKHVMVSQALKNTGYSNFNDNLSSICTCIYRLYQV